VWHVAGEPINKFELLLLVRDAFGLDVAIEPNDELVVDRSLDDSRFRAKTNMPVPSWPEMIAELAAAHAPASGSRSTSRVDG
jgi:dTDP-4-dehydrorhamnose reductase